VKRDFLTFCETVEVGAVDFTGDREGEVLKAGRFAHLVPIHET
jgi:hypothetical protein